MVQLMADALIITSPASMTAPLPGTPLLTLRGDVTTIASDGFSGAAAPLAGRVPDAISGGGRKPWKVEGAGSAWVTSGGRLVASPDSSGTYFAYFDSGSTAANREVQLSVRVTELPSAAVYLDLFRDSLSSDSRKMRLLLAVSGSVALSYSAPSASGETVSISGANFGYAAGDSLGLQYNTKTNAWAVYKNGVSVRDGIFTGLPRPLTGTMFGIAGTAGMSAGVLDDFKITETII